MTPVVSGSRPSSELGQIVDQGSCLRRSKSPCTGTYVQGRSRPRATTAARAARLGEGCAPLADADWMRQARRHRCQRRPPPRKREAAGAFIGTGGATQALRPASVLEAFERQVGGWARAHGSGRGAPTPVESGRRRMIARAFSRCRVTLRHCRRCSVQVEAVSPVRLASKAPSCRQAFMASRPHPPLTASAMSGMNCRPCSLQGAAV